MTCLRPAILAISVLLVSSCSKLQGMGGDTAQSGTPTTPHLAGGGGAPVKNTVRRVPQLPERCTETERSFSICGREPTRVPHFTASSWFSDRPDFSMPRSHKSR
jgi:hypothetical protein